MDNGKCCYCKETVAKGLGFIGVISFHDECFKKKFIKKANFGISEHIVFDK